MDGTVVGRTRFEVGIDRLDHVTDIAAGLSDVDDPGVVESSTLDERERVVVERQQQPVVRRRVRELFTIRVTEAVVVACRVDGPPATSEPIRDGNLDTLVTVDRPHAGAASAGRTSSMLS